ncbi:MAG: GNAT family N-acetyltransferase [Elusimicrobia bacterium]|nr:GNAT family N-acetyltransferase [Elusimicrobiota bacterium]
MHKIGLKLYSINDFYLKEAAVLYEQGVYDFIELLPVPASYERTLVWWKGLQIPFVVHAPHLGFGINLGRRELFDTNMAAVKETLAFADALNTAHIIFHPGTEGDICESARQLKVINDPRVLVENKPYKTVDGRFRCIGGSHEEIKLVIETAGTGFCLDIGHAISYAKNIGADWYDYLRGFLAMKPAMYHVSDGDTNSGTDTHEHIGSGNYAWDRILPLIPAGSLVTLETKKNSKKNLRDFNEDVQNYRHLTEAHAPAIAVRRVVGSDMHNIFKLSNEPFVRQYSINKKQITWQEHMVWFNAKIKDSSYDFFAAEVKGEFAAQVRYQMETGKMVVSLSIAGPFRGKGFASEILSTSARMVFAARPTLNEIIAYIDPENSVSTKVFTKVGYVSAGEKSISGRLFRKYALSRGNI